MRLDPPKPLGDIFEALCGVVFLDKGMRLGKTWDVFKGHLVSLIRQLLLCVVYFCEIFL